jgi:hypothetical protein
MLFAPRYQQIGLFALPYQLLFEALAPIIEVTGYLLVPITVISGLLTAPVAISLLLLAAILNVALCTASVLLAIHEQKALERRTTALFRYPRTRDLALLTFAGFLSNFGYRQYLLIWQLRGLRDFLKGRKEWDKFARRGFMVTGE